MWIHGIRELVGGVGQWFLDNMDREAANPFQFAYFNEVLAKIDTEAADQKALDEIRERWVTMARFETGTAWEGFAPDETCHNMGAVPTIYLSERVLGVSLDGPVANRRLTIEPHLGDLRHAEGVVVTELGPVSVVWNRPERSGKTSFELEIPPGVTARVLLPRSESPWTVDGRELPSNQDTASGKSALTLQEGRHRGE